MNCKYHKKIQSEYICSICNNPICGECMSTVNGKRVCHNCIDTNLFKMGGAQKGRSKFWNFIFSLIPGCGQMYMGMMNRGLQLLTAFVGIFVLGVLTEGVIVALGAIIWFYSFFDSLNIRRQILMGEIVTDSPIYPLNIGTINPKYIGYALVALGGLTILRSMTSLTVRIVNTIFNSSVPTYWINDIYRNITPLALLILGIILVRRAKGVEIPSKELIDIDEDQTIE